MPIETLKDILDDLFAWLEGLTDEEPDENGLDYTDTFDIMFELEQPAPSSGVITLNAVGADDIIDVSVFEGDASLQIRNVPKGSYDVTLTGQKIQTYDKHIEVDKEEKFWLDVIETDVENDEEENDIDENDEDVTVDDTSVHYSGHIPHAPNNPGLDWSGFKIELKTEAGDVFETETDSEGKYELDVDYDLKEGQTQSKYMVRVTPPNNDWRFGETGTLPQRGWGQYRLYPFYGDRRWRHVETDGYTETSFGARNVDIFDGQSGEFFRNLEHLVDITVHINSTGGFKEPDRGGTTNEFRGMDDKEEVEEVAEFINGELYVPETRRKGITEWPPWKTEEVPNPQPEGINVNIRDNDRKVTISGGVLSGMSKLHQLRVTAYLSIPEAHIEGVSIERPVVSIGSPVGRVTGNVSVGDVKDHLIIAWKHYKAMLADSEQANIRSSRSQTDRNTPVRLGGITGTTLRNYILKSVTMELKGMYEGDIPVEDGLVISSRADEAYYDIGEIIDDKGKEQAKFVRLRINAKIAHIFGTGRSSKRVNWKNKEEGKGIYDKTV